MIEQLVEKMKNDKNCVLNQFIKLLKYTTEGRKYLREQKLKRILQ